MNKVLIFLASVLTSLSAFAQEGTKTVSQEIAAQISAAVNSQEIQTILNAEDSGNLKRIEYFHPSRMNPKQARIEITFLSFGPQGLQTCPVNVFVNTSSNVVEATTKMPCYGPK